MKRIWIINGPNLNLLGIREPEIYGCRTLEDINEELRLLAQQKGVEVDFFQSNHEGELVDLIQKAYQQVDCIIINAGAFTHYSWAIYDALKAIQIPIIEVHLSNIYARESFRSQSLLSPLACGGIFGFGACGYKMALEAAYELLLAESGDR